jgi:anaerobic magnesium-protoporphyrin IX monomethyl ester cyclase
MGTSPVVLLVNPLPSTWYSRNFASVLSSPPLGILYLAAGLESEGWQVEVLDLPVDTRSKAEVGRYLHERQPYLVGVTCTTEAVSAALRLCRFIKEQVPGAYTVLGGPHPTFEYRAVMEEPAVDFVIRYEGDVALPQLVRALHSAEPALSAVPNLCWKEDGHLVVNPVAPFISDLDGLPLPARHLIDLSRYALSGALITSRGCPARCIFCSAGALAGGHYRCRSAGHVFGEIRHLAEDLGLAELYFLDDTFTANKARAAEICQLLVDAHLGITFGCESRVNIVDPGFLELLARAGCWRIQFGVESGSDEILRRVRKGTTTRQVRNAFAWAHDQGLVVKGSFILGHVWDTVETIGQTFDLMRELHEQYGAELYPGMNVPFPGTWQYEHRDELGLHLLSDNWDDYNFANCVIDTPHLSHLELRNLYFEIARYAVEANQRVRSRASEEANT